MAVKNVSTKKCAKCLIVKPFSEYAFRSFRGRRYPTAYCKPCWADRYRAERHADIEAHRAYKRAFYQRNIERQRALAKRSRLRNIASVRASLAAWRSANKDRVSKYRKNYLSENKDKFAEYSNNRRAAKLQAIPLWANRKEIRKIYKRAAVLGMHVDHIVPLVSPMVCGLHVESNLAIVSKAHNLSKGNRYWPDMP